MNPVFEGAPLNAHHNMNLVARSAHYKCGRYRMKIWWTRKVTGLIVWRTSIYNTVTKSDVCPTAMLVDFSFDDAKSRGKQLLKRMEREQAQIEVSLGERQPLNGAELDPIFFFITKEEYDADKS